MPPTPSDPNSQHDDGARIQPEYGLPHAIRLLRDPYRPVATSRPYAPRPSERRFTTLAGDPILQPPAPTMPAARSRPEGPPEALWPDLHEDRAIINRQPEGYDLTSGEAGQLDINVDRRADPFRPVPALIDTQDAAYPPVRPGERLWR